MDDIENKRKIEHDKYEVCYKNQNYKMGSNRVIKAHEAIRSLGFMGSFLDVGCGRGEIVEFAKREGFHPVQGVDVVEYLLNEDVIYGEAYSLPFTGNSVDVVTSFDAFEHFLPEDTEIALQEINRVAKRAVILCIQNAPSRSEGLTLHINIRPYKAWDKLIKRFIDGEVKWLPDSNSSQTWVITKE